MRIVTPSLLAVTIGSGLFAPPPATAQPSDERHQSKVGSLATEIVTARAVPVAEAQGKPVKDSVANGIAIGAAIAFRRTTRQGLRAAVAISVFYVIAGTLMVPWLWAEPLGPFLKIFPILVLNFVALAILEDR